MWPFGSDDSGFKKIGEQDAEYNDDGRLLCPQCGTEHWSLATRYRFTLLRRSLACENCGYVAELDEGVVIQK